VGPPDLEPQDEACETNKHNSEIKVACMVCSVVVFGSRSHSVTVDLVLGPKPH